MKNNRSYRKLYIVFFIIVLRGYSSLAFCQNNVIDSGLKQLLSGSQLQDPNNKRNSIGQCTQTMYEYHYYVSSNKDTLWYRSLSPVSLVAGKKYPLVLFLHGAGERGNDNECQLKHGSGLFINPVNRYKYPAWVLFPQCPKSKFGPFETEPSSLDGATFPEASATSFYVSRLKELLDFYMSKPEVDQTRIYVVGLSMGAMAAYDMACRFPDIFTAIIPICGAVNSHRLSGAKDICFRIFHGEKDEAVPVSCSREAYRVLKEYGAKVEYIEFYGCGHLSWYPAFNYPDFMDWLFNQKK